MARGEGNVPGDGVEDQHGAAVDHVPLVPGQVVEKLRDEGVLFDAESGQHGLLPEAASTHDGGECVDNAQGQDALYGTGDKTQSESLGVVFIPGLDVECEKSCTLLAKLLAGL